MLDGSMNGNLYPEWLAYIRNENVRAAFLYLVGLATCSDRFVCWPQWHGNAREFVFREGQERPFAFLVYECELHFYFRRPAIRSGRYSRERLGEHFLVTDGGTGGCEWTVRLHNTEDVVRLWGFLHEDVAAGVAG